MEKIDLKKSGINYRRPSNMEQMKSKMVDELLANRKVREVMQELNVSLDELNKNIGKFIRILEADEECTACSKEKCPFSREGMVPYIVRDEFGDLVVKYDLCEKARINRLLHLNYLIKDFDPMFDDYEIKSIDVFAISNSKEASSRNFATLKELHEIRSKGVSRDNNFIIFAKRGCGKTGYVAALTNHYVKENYKCAFVDVRRLMSILIAKISMKESYNSIINDLNNADVLVLDNLGDEKISEWTRTVLSDILSNRNRQDKMTIITTSHNYDDLASLYAAIKGENFRANKIKADDLLNQIKALMRKELYLRDA